MIITKRHDEARCDADRHQTDGQWSVATPYFGCESLLGDKRPAPPIGDLRPMAFKIEFDPHYVSKPHFHLANQFQIFVAGSGTVGKAKINPVSVHYAAAYTPYGPLCGGEDGLTYLTLRNGFDPGLQYMPEKRALLKAANRHPRVHAADAVTALAAPLSGGDPVYPSVLGEHDDGLGAWFYRIPAGESVQGPGPASGGGQYWLVLSGSGDLGNTGMSPLDCTYLSPDEPSQRMSAGNSGVEVMALQFPAFIV